MSDNKELLDTLKSFGAAPDGVVFLQGPASPAHLDYLDLQKLPAAGLPSVEAVVSMAGRPLLYVTQGPFKKKGEIDHLCHLLAQRGAADHLAVVTPGVLTVYPVVSKKARAGKRWEAKEIAAQRRIPSLAYGFAKDTAPSSAQTLHAELVEQLSAATNTIKGFGASDQDALSLVGRALFLRFLIDRKILQKQDLMKICPGATSLEESMSRPEWVTATGEWLDTTFNGNLLPLSLQGKQHAWRKLSKTATEKICVELDRILHKTNQHGQFSFEWATLDFGHIPVGLLSQVYENWSHKSAPEESRAKGVWYTPRSIAEYTTSQAFFELPDAHKARVLDPSVGAGVFLVAAYREIVNARWQHDDKRPDRETLRKILYEQLTGFDINEGALRLSALSLYLTALELDPDPQPHEQLGFKNLRDLVLFDVKGPLDKNRKGSDPVFGSLGSHIPGVHRGAYDVVIGNPPWTPWIKDEDRRGEVEKVVTKILQERTGEKTAAFEMLDYAPDLPFFWRAMEWAKPGGIIALALHARLLFRLSDGGVQARNQVLRAAATTYILNCTEIRKTQVWPSHEAPFCLWFALNRPSTPEEGFYFVSPRIDGDINKNGYIRIDASAAKPVFASQLQREPSLLKKLFKGTSLHISLTTRKLSTLGEYWNDNLLEANEGYHLGGKRSTRSITHLKKLPDFNSHSEHTPLIDTEKLKKFGSQTATEPRTKEAFTGPLVLSFEAPRQDRKKFRALLSWQSITFSQSFHGFSTAGHAEEKLLARYLFLYLNSSYSLYSMALTSPRFAVSRDDSNLQDFLSLPFVSIENLSTEEKKEIERISEIAFSSKELPEEEIDTFIGKLFGLSSWDLEVIRDTLEVSLPSKASRDRAQGYPESKEIKAFVARVQDLLSQTLVHSEREVACTPIPSNQEPWLLFHITTWGKDEPKPTQKEPSSALLTALWKIAREQGSSRIIVRGDKGQLLIGVFAQYRYWTPTQARILALDLLGDINHEAWLRGEG